MIKENLRKIKEQIEQDCQSVGKESSSIKLLAVSKTKPIEDIIEAYNAGQSAFGENYVQEGVDKIQYLNKQNIYPEWHFIGPLQSNKTKLVAENFDWIQTLDRKKIALRLHKQRPIEKKPLNVLIQINISNEENKSGISPQEIKELAEYIISLSQLRLRGIMIIPKPLQDPKIQEETFLYAKKLFTNLQNKFPTQQIDTLSMGMSDDMDIAIKSGSTMVRIGTAIFGKRNYS